MITLTGIAVQGAIETGFLCAGFDIKASFLVKEFDPVLDVQCHYTDGPMRNVNTFSPDQKIRFIMLVDREQSTRCNGFSVDYYFHLFPEFDSNNSHKNLKR